MRQEMTGLGMAVASAGPLRKQSEPRSRQIATPTPHHSIFTGWVVFLMSNHVKALKQQVIHLLSGVKVRVLWT